MGLLDNLFKSKPESGGEKSVGPPGNRGTAEPHTPAAKCSPFLAPKIYVPRSSVQIVLPAHSHLQGEHRPEPVPGVSFSAKEIVLTLGDVLSRIPPHFLRQGTTDVRRELRFPADGLAADIARGRAAVFLADIVAQCPDVFAPEADGFDDIQIRLPLQKLVEQIARAPVARPAVSTELPAENPVAALPPPADPKPPGEVQIHLSLAAILKRCPKEIIVAPLPPIDESVRVVFPFSPIARQLATGQVEVSSLRFVAALPPDLMKCFEAAAGVKVPLPLEEIFQNLPNQTPLPEHGPSAEERDRAFQNAKLAESILLGTMDVPQGNGTSILETDALLAELPAPVDPGNVVIAGNFAALPEAEVHMPPAAELSAISVPEIPIESPEVEAPLEIENKFAAPAPAAIAPAPPLDAPPVRPSVPWLRPPVLLQPKTGPEEIPPALVVSSGPEPPPTFQPPRESIAPDPISPPVDALPPPPAEPAPEPLAVEPATLPATPLRIGLPRFGPMLVLPPRFVAGPLNSTASAAPEPPANPEPEPVAEISHIAPAPPAPVEKSVAPLTLDGKVRELFPSESPLELPRVGQLLAALPGIRGCVIAAHAAEFHGGELPAGLDVAAIRDMSRQMHSALAGRSVQHITLHAEDYSLSLFTRAEACVCAIHRARIFLPGVREKFAAVAEELSRGF